jgi:hypothetical protein
VVSSGACYIITIDRRCDFEFFRTASNGAAIISKKRERLAAA